MVPVVLTDNLLAVQLPQPRIMIRARRYEIGRVCAKGTVPDPALVAGQGGLEREGLGLVVGPGRAVLDLPNLGSVVGAAGGELLDIRGEEDARDVFFMRGEVRHGDHASSVVFLFNLPDKDIALQVGQPPSRHGDCT